MCQAFPPCWPVYQSTLSVLKCEEAPRWGAACWLVERFEWAILLESVWGLGIGGAEPSQNAWTRAWRRLRPTAGVIQARR